MRRGVGLRVDDEGVGTVAAGRAGGVAGGQGGGDGMVAGFTAVSSGAWAASCSNAIWSAWGSARPRRAARRRIPVAALGLKQYFEGTWGSTTADKQHSSAALGDSEVARIQHPPRNAVPEFIQRGEDRLEVPAVVGGQEPGDVLQEKPARR